MILNISELHILLGYKDVIATNEIYAQWVGAEAENR